LISRWRDARFFNQPYATADFDHWCKAEHWSLDEAIALVMGKAPEIVSWDKIKAFSSSPFVKRYARLRDLSERAKVWQKLFDPVLPVIFIKWAEDNEIPVPTELLDKVAKLKGKLIDWKEQYQGLQAAFDQLNSDYDKFRGMYDEHVGDWKSLVQQKLNAIAAGQERIAKLEAEVAALKEPPPTSDQTKPQSPIERQNMLKTIYGMAVIGYGYDPADKRSRIIPEIVGDLALAGLALSDDTIRRYLREAYDCAAEWRDQDG
jgi:hypothetical protein